MIDATIKNTPSAFFMAPPSSPMSDPGDPDTHTTVEPVPLEGRYSEDAPDVSGSVYPGSALSPKDGSVPDLLGAYRIDCRLAAGGMGSIYLARRQGGDGAVVAIKCIHSHLAVKPAFVAMFIDEARITSGISHPSVCKVLEYGLEGRQPYLVMEFILGEHLQSITQARRRLADDGISAPAQAGLPSFESFAVAVIASICDGLHAAHQLRDEAGHLLGVVHRDVSPANLFVTYDGGVRVLDFGVAKAAGRAHETMSGVVKGKFAYMSPEQMAGADVDLRTDIWSAGVVLFELLTGRRLFRRQTEAATVHAVLHEGVPSLISLAPESSPELAAIVARCLAIDRNQRYESAALLAADLRGYLEKRGGVPDAAQIGAVLQQLFPDGRARKEQLLAEARVLGDAQHGRIARVWRDRRFVASGVLLLGLCTASLALWAGARREPSAGLSAARVTAAQQASGARLQATPVSQDTASREIGTVSAGAAPRVLEAGSATSGAETLGPKSGAAIAAAEVIAEADRIRLEKAAARRGPGFVNIATPGGWAEVFWRGRRLGAAPGRYELPAGRQRLELHPFGTGRARIVAVDVRARETARLSVPIDEPPAR